MTPMRNLRPPTATPADSGYERASAAALNAAFECAAPAGRGRSGGKLAGHMREMPPASDTIYPRDRREIETYGVIERTADGAIERTADGLNPLTINHTAKTIS